MLTKKRTFDLFSASLVLLLVVPLSLFFYPTLVFLIGKPIIFKQERIGKKGKKFTIYKLRSMNKNASFIKNKYLTLNEAPAPMFKIDEDPRFIKKEITFFGLLQKPLVLKVGRFLSYSGLDEVPQFWNILRGEMSLIGPRPLPVAEAERLKKIDPKWYSWRHSVQPGIFSIWAVDPQHNKSLNYWKKLEKETLQMNDYQKLRIIGQVIVKQSKNLFQS